MPLKPLVLQFLHTDGLPTRQVFFRTSRRFSPSSESPRPQSCWASGTPECRISIRRRFHARLRTPSRHTRSLAMSPANESPAGPEPMTATLMPFAGAHSGTDIMPPRVRSRQRSVPDSRWLRPVRSSSGGCTGFRIVFFLRTNTSADSRERGSALQHAGGIEEFAPFDVLDERRDVDAYRASLHTCRVGAVQAAPGFGHGLLGTEADIHFFRARGGAVHGIEFRHDTRDGRAFFGFMAFRISLPPRCITVGQLAERSRGIHLGSIGRTGFSAWQFVFRACLRMLVQTVASLPSLPFLKAPIRLSISSKST